MRAADTNILVRLVTRDDKAQCERAIKFFDDNEVYLPKTVLLELEWVLRYSYALDSPAIIDAINAVLDMKCVVPEDESAIREALTLMAESIDFADALHLASSSTCMDMATFDQVFARKAKRAGRGRVALL